MAEFLVESLHKVSKFVDEEELRCSVKFVRRDITRAFGDDGKQQ